ncbi:hypothetical protein GCM10010286_15150 [Streptomyces toxytricini]|nr:hypothetical protein GCM10010286_15150 [Streptomyces toxytricini]
MTRTNLTQRLALPGACRALAAGGAVLPSTASARARHAADSGRPDDQGDSEGRQIDNKTTTSTTYKEVKTTLNDGRVMVTTTKTATKTTKNHQGKVLKKVVTTTKYVEFQPAPQPLLRGIGRRDHRSARNQGASRPRTRPEGSRTGQNTFSRRADPGSGSGPPRRTTRTAFRCAPGSGGGADVASGTDSAQRP